MTWWPVLLRAAAALNLVIQAALIGTGVVVGSTVLLLSAAACCVAEVEMGHRPARNRCPVPPPPPLPPPAPTRLVPLRRANSVGLRQDLDDLWAAALEHYVHGDPIQGPGPEEFEAALDHVIGGGRGCEEFPYLPVFPMPRMDDGRGMETRGELR